MENEKTTEYEEQKDSPVFTESIQNFASNTAATLGPLASRIGKGFTHVGQMAREKIGNAEKTELPESYLELEKKIDAYSKMIQHMIHIATQMVQPGVVTEMKTLLSEININIAIPKKMELDVNPKSSFHVLSQAMHAHGMAIGDESALGNTLLKCSEMHNRLGAARLAMDQDIYAKFITGLKNFSDTQLKACMAARRQVNSSRLDLDACKSRIKGIRNPDKLSQCQMELNQLQHQFDSTFSDSKEKMINFLKNDELLGLFADFMHSLLGYFKSGYDLLSEIVPEMDALKVAQENLKRESGSDE